jgi:2-octaprenyl-6-methoxyphenol hydroxylase
MPARAISRAMTHDVDVLIAGGGLNGTTLALALASGGLSVALVDPAPAGQREGAFDGRSYALALTSQRLLKVLGVWTRIAEHAQPILEIKVTDGRAGEGPSPFVLEFDHAEIEEGPMGYMMEDRFLRRALLDALAAPRSSRRSRGRSRDIGPKKGLFRPTLPMAAACAPA